MLLRKIFSLPTLTLMVALTLSAIAAWYSILGLTAIFAAAVIPVIIMGGSLEVAKIVTTVWLHRYWDKAGIILKLYLVPAVMILAFITSLGVFGFLSKAHSDQSLVSGDVIAQIEIYDQKITTEKDNIASNQKALQQLDAAVDQVMARSEDVNGATKSVQIRRSQTSERNRLNNEIQSAQEIITKLNAEAAPIRAQIRKVEAEVGPIKYIAAMIYGDNPDANLLEKAVRWVIILIVMVFDPLALILVIAAQRSYEWIQIPVPDKKPDDDDYTDDYADTITDEIEPESQPVIIEEEEESANEILPITDEEEPEHNIIDHDVELFPCEESPTTEYINPEDVSLKIEEESTGQTFPVSETGYVNFNGKNVQKDALISANPYQFAAVADNSALSQVSGTKFPLLAQIGAKFTRTDLNPPRTYAFNGKSWDLLKVEEETMTDQYMKYLITLLESGEYTPDMLSEEELEYLSKYLDK